MKEKYKLIRLVLLLVVAGAAYWQRDRFFSGRHDTTPGSPSTSRETSSAATEKQGAYEVLEGCRLMDHRHNDGDSFFIQQGNRKIELRLYFVDCPEKYLSDDFPNQRKRVAEQAREMGGLTLNQAVAIGQEAKKFTRDLLEGKSFTVYTYWERVYDGGRFYGFVRVPGAKKFLGEELVARGLARIHTKGPGSKQKPVPTPDGKSFHQQRDELYRLERVAQAEKRGAWGVK